mmetsp:Transcript_15093/g.42128  ORF Transcript_15093/g.42128 Transcript_15093/m.42128 type:complete len:126 (-) Transcript_15093:147-524(-)
MAHHYASPGPFGCSAHPGPKYRKELREALDTRNLRLQQETSWGGSSAQSGMLEGGGATRLARTQMKVHELHANTLMQHKDRILSGALFGHSSEAGMSTAQRVANRAGCRRTASLPLLAAGAAAAR